LKITDGQLDSPFLLKKPIMPNFSSRLLDM
jgi:hypothetical protein